TSMEVYLGPRGDKIRGSKPQKGECRAVDDLNAETRGNGKTPLSTNSRRNRRGTKQPGPRWIKGHLLNENLGGPGLAKNLTPLTSTANKNHSGKVEKAVIAAVNECRQFAERNPKADFWYGVYYKVTVSEEKAFPNARDPAHKAVRKSIT